MLPLSVAASPAGSAGQARAAATVDWPRNVAFRASAEMRASALWVVLLVSIGVGVGLGHVRIRATIRDLRSDSLATRQIVQRLELEERGLLAQAERLSSDERVARVAKVRLGMIRPTKGQQEILP